MCVDARRVHKEVTYPKVYEMFKYAEAVFKEQLTEALIHNTAESNNSDFSLPKCPPSLSAKILVQDHLTC